MLITYLVIAYLIGTFPSGLIISKFYKVDITKEGSGNTGATNIARTLGKKAGIFTLLIDTLKGILAVVLAKNFCLDDRYHFIIAFIVVLGHCFSIPKVFKGGKGVATGLGALIALNYLFAVVGLLTFAVVFYFSKIVSISSIAAVIIIPIFGLIYGLNYQLITILLAISLLIAYRHSENIQRLIKGEEKKFVLKK